MNTEYLNTFQERLETSLLSICQADGLAGERLNESEDIDNLWLKIANGYLGDAVPCVASYPTVSVAWACFLGMAVANLWDADFDRLQAMAYEEFYGSEGFDNMDEHIVRDILGMPLKDEAAVSLNNTVRRLAEHTVSAIRHEQVEPQSPLAFHIFARSCTVMYRLGASLELSRQGYNMVKQ